MSIGKQTPAVQQDAIQRSPRWKKVSVGVACILISYAVFYRLVLISNGWPDFDSDQAIMGLMSRHIWLDGEHPLFFYGQYYVGPLEAYATVPFFAIFGSSVLALRLAMLPLVILFLAFVYILGRIMYGPMVALLSLAWLSLGPSIAVFRQLAAGDGKQEELALSGLIVLCAWARLRLPERRPRDTHARLLCLATYGIIGAACGLAVWSDWLSAPLVVITVFALLIARPREVLSWSGAALILGFLVGGWPFIQFNVANQFASVTQLLYFSGNSTGPSLHLGGLLAQLDSAATITLPALFGSPDVCIQSATGGLCSLLNGMFTLLIVGCYVLAAWPLVRITWRYIYCLRERLQHLGHVPRHVLFGPVGAAMLWRRLDAPLTEVDARWSARLWSRGIVLASGLVMLAAFLNNPMVPAYPLDYARYLVPLYLSAPVLFGVLWESLRPALAVSSRSLGRWREGEQPIGSNSTPAVPAHLARNRKALALAARVMLTCLLVFSAMEGAATIVASTDSATYALPAPPWSARILAAFDAHGVRTFYADSYYDCYNLAFASNERQVCAVLDPDGHVAQENWINRYAPYVAAVANDPHHAFLSTASLAEEAKFRQGDLPGQGYVRMVVGSFAIYYYQGGGGAP